MTTPNTGGYLIGSLNNELDFFINGSVQEAIIAFAARWQGYSDVFKTACLAMETWEQAQELYSMCYHDVINFICVVGDRQLLYAPKASVIDCQIIMKNYNEK